MLSALAYHRPASLDEARAMLQQFGRDALLLAGGTDVIPDLERGLKTARHVVSLRDLDALRGIRVVDGFVRIGALVTPTEIARSDVIASRRPELGDAVGVFGSPQVRNRATVGGNLCSAASCGDLPPLLIALDARVRLIGEDGEREVALETFFTGARQTQLGPGEILVDVLVPVRSPGEGACYEVFGRRGAAFISVAGVAAFVEVEDGVCRRARVVVGAVAETPLFVPAAGEALEGRSLEDAAIAAAAEIARDAARPITDVRGSSDYRREVLAVLATRALRTARERSRE
ncbi:MAG: FAD binding domain-containing protein [Planctomycetota bacterium]